MKKIISIIIRTFNEEKYLPELLKSIKVQRCNDYEIEIVLVDSGSTDNTLAIAKKNHVKILHLKKEDFSFGRSLNIGCEASKGNIFVIISGHCIPKNSLWLKNLIAPVLVGYEYSYGRQVGRDTTYFSENQVFSKQYPYKSSIPQKGFFCNNANSAISKKIWKKYKFNEDITGCEDMELAKRYVDDGGKLAYVSNAIVYHIHNEDWGVIRKRYERESLALQFIMPEVTLSIFDVVYFFVIAVIKDFNFALKQKKFLRNLLFILRYRYEQYYGSYIGNHISRKISQSRKLDYFYPRIRK